MTSRELHTSMSRLNMPSSLRRWTALRRRLTPLLHCRCVERERERESYNLFSIVSYVQLQVKQADVGSGVSAVAKPVPKATVDTSVTDIDAALNSLQVQTLYTIHYRHYTIHTIPNTLYTLYTIPNTLYTLYQYPYTTLYSTHYTIHTTLYTHVIYHTQYTMYYTLHYTVPNTL